MDDPPISPHDDDCSSIPDELAFAAEAAAQAVEEADAATAQCQQQQFGSSSLHNNNASSLESTKELKPSEVVCRICGRGNDDGRPIIRFLPAPCDNIVSAISPSVQTFHLDISLHVFCGKTATILPNVNRPEMEILSKAGIKNKHGIGQEVNSALARTRCAILQQTNGGSDKGREFYLVQEFEANLQVVRNATTNSMDPLHTFPDLPNLDPHHHFDPNLPPLQVPTLPPLHQAATSPLNGLPPLSALNSELKEGPVRAAAGQFQKPGRQYHSHSHSGGSSSSRNNAGPTALSYPLTSSSFTSDGKVICGCGGLHWPAGTPRGTKSFQTHLTSKQHRDWMEANGVFGSL